MRAKVMQGLHAWKALAPRERFLLGALAWFLIALLLYLMAWQPSQQRLVSAEQRYQRQLALAQQLKQAQPGSALQAQGAPQASKISQSAEAAGLSLQQIEVESDQLRLTLSGDAQALLTWLAQLEREAGAFQMLTLEKRDNLLEARLVL
ncbi:type II secretion system protein GspM [Pseudomonas kairouanensis]|nr:type II secretion system protein GspM [Pseudomonas kairouanensis]